MQIEYLTNLFSNDQELSRSARTFFFSLRDTKEWQSDDVLQFLIARLSFDAPVEYQKVAITVLGCINNKKATPYLVKFFKESDDEIPYYLPLTLAKLGGKEVVNVLLEKLYTTKSESLKREIIESLGRIGDSGTEESILPFIAKSTNNYIRSVAIAALGTCGKQRSAEKILSILNDPSDKNYEFYSLCSALHGLQLRNFIPHNDNLFEVSYFLPLEAFKLRENIQNKDLDMIPIYLDHYSDIGFLLEDRFCPVCDGDTTQQSIVFQIGTDAISPLIKYIEDNSKKESGKIEALNILAMIKSDSALPLLIHVFCNENNTNSMRKMAAIALGSFSKHEQVVSLLIEYYPKVDFSIQVGIFWAFKNLKSPKALPLLFDYLTKDCFSDRQIGIYYANNNYNILDIGVQVLPIHYDYEKWNVTNLVIQVIKEIGTFSPPEIIKFLLKEKFNIKEDVLLGLLFVLFHLRITKQYIDQIASLLKKIASNPPTKYHMELANYFLVQ